MARSRKTINTHKYKQSSDSSMPACMSRLKTRCPTLGGASYETHTYFDVSLWATNNLQAICESHWSQQKHHRPTKTHTKNFYFLSVEFSELSFKMKIDLAPEESLKGFSFENCRR